MTQKTTDIVCSQITAGKTEPSSQVHCGLLPLRVLYRRDALPRFVVSAFRAVLGGACPSL
jgi:hypothetical protein